MSASTFVGELDLLAERRVRGIARAAPDASDTTARVLVRRGRELVGFVRLPLNGGGVDETALSALLEQHPPADAPPPTLAFTPPITVVVCTRDRPDLLRRCLRSLAALRYPAFVVLVVDNAPSTTATRDVVTELASEDTRLRYTVEPRRGLSCARNHGLREARTRIVAFTDDDVTVDEWWLHGVAAGFARAPGVACVTGIVPAADLADDGQRYFEERYSWSARTRPRLYDLAANRDDSPLYPYSAGLFGTGANMAVDREVMLRIGGFDEALGAGTRAAGGEDLDAFVRVLHAGARIAYEPAAIVWHHHRPDEASQRDQLVGYGTGLTAYLAKCITDPAMRWQVLRSVPRGAAALIRAWRRPGKGAAVATQPKGSVLAEAGGMLRGPSAYFRERAERRHGQTVATRSVRVCDAALLLAVALWIAAVLRVNPEAMNTWGLLPALPVAFFGALGLLVGSTAWLVTRPVLSPMRLALHLGAFIVVIHATPPLLFGEPIYAWLYKHAGVVAFISTEHALDPSIDIYQNWPGFFALVAWLTEVTGIGDPITFAAWAPVFFNGMSCLVLRFVFVSLELGDRTRWLGLFLFVAGNWVGQDYFAPQALAFVLGLATLGMVLAWCDRHRAGAARKWTIVALYATFAAVVATHQLSPVVVVLSVGALTVGGFVRPRWLVVGLGAMTAGYVAWHYAYLSHTQDLLGPLGDPIHNLLGRPTDNVPVTGRRITALGAPVLTLWLAGLGAIGVLRRRRARQPVARLVILAAAPLLLPLAQNYGGEVVFRIYLFALPWIAVLAAAALAAGTRRRWLWPPVALGGLSVAFGLLVFTTFGGTELHRVRAGEIAASRYFYERAEPGGMLALATLNFPTRLGANYDDFNIGDVNPPTMLTTDESLQRRRLGASDVPAVVRFLRSHKAPNKPAYLVLSRGQTEFAEVLGYTPPGALASLQRALDAAPEFSVFHRNADATIYRLGEATAGEVRTPPPTPAVPSRATTTGVAIAIGGPLLVLLARRRRHLVITSVQPEESVMELTSAPPSPDTDDALVARDAPPRTAATEHDAAALHRLLVEDQSPAVRANAAVGLAVADRATQRAALADALADPSPQVRAAALDALPIANEPEAARLVFGALEDTDTDVRAAAGRRLAASGDWLLWHGVRTTGHRDELVAAAAAALGTERFGQLLAQRAVSPDTGERRLALELCAAVPSLTARQAAIAALADEDLTVRLAAVAAVTTEPEAIPELLRSATRDPSERIRTTVLRALAHVDDDGVRAALVTAAVDPDATVRHVAADALVEQRSRGLARLLAERLTATTATVLVPVLLRMGAVGEDALASALADASGDTAAAIRAGVGGTAVEARWRLETSAYDDSVRERARRAVAVLDAPTAPLRLDLATPETPAPSNGVISS